MSLTRRVYGGRKSRNSKKGRGHCRIGGKKTLKKGGKRVLSLGGKSLKNRKKSKRRSKGGGGEGLMVSELSGHTDSVPYGAIAEEMGGKGYYQNYLASAADPLMLTGVYVRSDDVDSEYIKIY